MQGLSRVAPVQLISMFPLGVYFTCELPWSCQTRTGPNGSSSAGVLESFVFRPYSFTREFAVLPDFKTEWDAELNDLDKPWYEDPDQLGDKLRDFAEEQGLVTPCGKSGEP